MTMRVALVLMAGLLATAAVGEETVAAAQAAPKGQSAPLAEAEKLSYALGMDLATHFKRQSMPVLPDPFARGLRDAMSGGSTALTQEEANALIEAFRMEMQRKFAELQKKSAAERQAAAEKAKLAGEEFRTANKAKPGVVALESGLQYEVLREGSGGKPGLEDSVECQYRGTLVDGTEFDSSYTRDQPATFAVKGVIKGWTEALQLMPVGSKWRIVVPPELAYGERGSGPIPPGSTLVFELELLGIK